jgi:hypothetical protein
LEHGIADLDAGNSAPNKLYLHPFPVDMAIHGIPEEHPRGSAAVSGMVLADFHVPIYSMLIKDKIQSCLSAYALGGNDDLLNTWHEFACNMANVDPSHLLPSLLGIVYIAINVRQIEESYADQLSETQLITLTQMTAAREAIKESSIGVIDSMPIGHMLMLSVAGGERGVGVFFYLEAYREYQVITTELLPIFADLKLVEYPELSTPPELMKYPIPPPEED